jgi:hypothetical protein
MPHQLIIDRAKDLQPFYNSIYRSTPLLPGIILPDEKDEQEDNLFMQLSSSQNSIHVHHTIVVNP